MLAPSWGLLAVNAANKGTSAAAGIAGSIVVIAAWLLHQYVGVDLPAEVAGAVGMILTPLLGYFIHDGSAGDKQPQP